MTETVKIIENGFVITCDAQRRIGNYTILTKADRIAEISSRGEMLKSLYPAAEVIDASGALVLPGFIDAHVHGESFLLRHFTSNKPLSQWMRDKKIRSAFDFVYKKASPQDLSVIYRLAYFNALRSGVTMVGEFGFDNLDEPLQTAFEAMKRADLRGYIGLHNGDQIERSRTLKQPGIHFAAVLPGEEDLTTYSLQSVLRAAADLKIPLVAHVGETKKSSDAVKRNFQKTIVKLLQEHRLLEGNLVLVHTACVEAGDLDILANSKAPIVLTPRSALWKGTEQPPVTEFLLRKVPVVLASDWTLPDPFAAIRSYAALVRNQGAEIPSAVDLLTMVTSEPAKALGRADAVGTLEVGKKADMVFVESSSAGALRNAKGDYDSLLFSFLLEATSRSVTDVMINGEFFVRKGHILTYSEEDLIRESDDLMNKLVLSSENQRSAQQMKHHDQEDRAPRIEFPDSHYVEEGFRVIPKEEASAKSVKKIFPLPLDPPAKTDSHDRVKKVFGDEDF
jgi:5-methylthioadenosine/S-adenosylhomocysteine deaminase